MTIPGAIALAACLAAACTSGPGGLGAPCETKDDCKDDLICDEHEGQASCQEPHGHGDDTEHHDTEHHDTGHDDTGHGHDTGSETHHHDTDSDSHHHDTDEGSSSGTTTA